MRQTITSLCSCPETKKANTDERGFRSSSLASTIITRVVRCFPYYSVFLCISMRFQFPRRRSFQSPFRCIAFESSFESFVRKDDARFSTFETKSLQKDNFCKILSGKSLREKRVCSSSVFSRGFYNLFVVIQYL